MSRAGPPSKPVEILKLRGSNHQYERKGEPAIDPGEPIPPAWLEGRALAHWPIVCEWLRNMGVLSPAWGDVLAGYCEAFAEYEDLVEECKGQPKVVFGKSGAPYLNPLYAAKAKALERVIKIAKELGITPAAKAALRVEDRPKPSGKDKHFA